MKFKAFGRQVDIKVSKDKKSQSIVSDAQDMLRKYISYCKPYHQRMIENEEWYKARHWPRIRNEKFKDDPEPTTAYILSTVANKHADAMDYYPKPNIRPRSAKDVAEAQKLSEIMPVELEYNDFYDAWWHVWHNKLTLGVGIYSVLFDPFANDGLGSNTINSIDPLSFICDPFVEDINKSKWVFTFELMTMEDFERSYPDSDAASANKFFEPEKYAQLAGRDTADMVLVIDGYYLETNDAGKKGVHLLKFAGDQVLYWSKEDANATDGFYTCDIYPFLLDTMYYEKGNIFGFGLIDVVKSPQIYIDKLDQIILANAFAHSRKRHAVPRSANVNKDQWLDPSQSMVEYDGNFQELVEIKTEPTHAAVFNHRTQKIDELKDTSSANEFSRGESGGGVTAAQAIVALQKASGKTSRASIQKSYNVFSKVIYVYIEHMRQFYDMPRDYRISDKTVQGGMRFESYDNAGLLPQPLNELAVEGMEQYRKPIFDILVEPEKRDPFSEQAHNELAKELYGAGVFNPEQYLPATVLLSMMEFDGKERIEEMLKENSQIQQQLMMGQMAVMENQKLKMIVQTLTGQDLGVQVPEKGAM